MGNYLDKEGVNLLWERVKSKINANVGKLQATVEVLNGTVDFIESETIPDLQTKDTALENGLDNLIKSFNTTYNSLNNRVTTLENREVSPGGDNSELLDGINQAIEELQGTDYRLQSQLNTTIDRVGKLEERGGGGDIPEDVEQFIDDQRNINENFQMAFAENNEKWRDADNAFENFSMMIPRLQEMDATIESVEEKLTWYTI